MITHEVDKKTFNFIVQLMKQATGGVRITHHSVGDCTLFHYHYKDKDESVLFGRNSWYDNSYSLILDGQEWR